MLKPIKKTSVSDAVFEQLRDRIVSGEMEAGSTLPSERALAETLQVNRGAVREALKRLEQARLIAINHGGSTRVLDFQKTAGTELLAELLLQPDGGFRADVAVGVMELRSALCADIARRCAERMPEASTALSEITTKMKEERDLEVLRQLDMEFWSILVDGSQNVAYRLVFNSIVDIYDKLAVLVSHVVAEEFKDVDARTRLVDAVAAQDADNAEFYGRELVERGETKMREVARKLKGDA